MTEIATRTDYPVSMIQSAAQDMAAAAQLARALCTTALVPQHFRGKPDDGAAAIMYGATIDMDPMTSLQNIVVINGKPGLYARAMVAIVLSRGHLIWTEEDTPKKVVVCGSRKGSGNVERSEWTIERAQLAGYTNNAKYKTDPQAMLYARASGDIARKVAPDALLGMAYNVEELRAEEALDGPPVTVERSGTARLAAALAPPPDVEAPVETVEVEPTAEDFAAMNAEAAPEPEPEPSGLFT